MEKRIDIQSGFDMKSMDEASKKTIETIENAMNDGLDKIINGISGYEQQFKEAIEDAKDIFSKSDKAIKERVEAIEKKMIEYNSLLKKGEPIEKDKCAEKIYEAFKGFVVEDTSGKKRIDLKGAFSNAQGKRAVTFNTKEATTILAGGMTSRIEQEPGITSYPKYKPWIFDVANVERIDSPYITYVECRSGNGEAGFVAEGAKKPQMDLTFDMAQASAHKVALYSKISTEALYDIDGLFAELRTDIFNQIDKATENGILFGSGEAGTLTGVTKKMPAFTLTGASVSSPQMYDAVVAAYTQVLSGSYGQYVPTQVVMNPIDILNMRLTKDAEGRYLMPIMLNSNEVVQLNLIPSTAIGAGKILVGDFRYLNVRTYIDFMLYFGYENDDITRNLVTVVGEKRLAAYIKDNHKSAFVYDSFANIITAITKS